MTEAMPFLQKTILLSYDPRPLVAGGLCWIGCISSRLNGDKKTMRRSRNRKEAEKVKIP